MREGFPLREQWSEVSPFTGTGRYAYCRDCGLFFEVPREGSRLCRPCVLVWIEDQKRERERAEAERLTAVAREESRRREEVENLRKEVDAFSEAKKNPLKYGITPEDYLAMCEAQGWACPSCKRRCSPVKFFRAAGEDPIGLVFQLDHDEALRKTLSRDDEWKCVRGLLCSACNTSFGQMGEDPERIDGLLNYAKFFAAGGKNKVLLERRGRGSPRL